MPVKIAGSSICFHAKRPMSTILKILSKAMYLHMNFGLYSNKARDISFESHLSSLEQEPKQILLEIRDFVVSIRKNRTEPPSVNTIQSPLQSADIKAQIAVAYNSIK
jgi:hypothetical protein